MKTSEVILKTAGKTIEQIMGTYEFGEKPSLELAEQIRKSYELIDGCEILVGDSMFGDGYTLLNWKEDDDHKFKEFIYAAEQDEMFGSYVDEREEFDFDWRNRDYEPMGALVFRKDEAVLKTGD